MVPQKQQELANSWRDMWEEKPDVNTQVPLDDESLSWPEQQPTQTAKKQQASKGAKTLSNYFKNTFGSNNVTPQTMDSNARERQNYKKNKLIPQHNEKRSA